MRLSSLPFVLVSLSLVPPAGAADAKRPNVLFIAVDDLRPELNCYGAAHIKSPNLDRLAAAGTLFNRAYCQQAVCSPSRTSLLTGLRPDSTRVYDLQTHFRRLLPDVVTLPQQFKLHGYHTEAMGKIYHGGLDDAVSWSVPLWNARQVGAGGARQNENRANRATATTPEELEQQARQQQQARQGAPRGPAWASPDVPDNGLFDGRMAEHAVDRLKDLAAAAAEKPFFLAVGFQKPHLPFIAPKKYFDVYDPAQIKLAANPYHPKGGNQYTLTNSGELRSYEGVPKQGAIPDDMARQLKHAYYACVSYLDANVGRLLDALDSLKLRDNTIVVLWGDHGWKLGEHGEWCKHSNVEDDTRVTMLLSAPGLKPGQRTNSLAEFVDIYPTLCDLAGLPKPSHLEGTSLVPVLKDPVARVKTAALSQYPRAQVMGYSIRTDRYRLTRWARRDSPEEALAVELYDHQTDPAENTNIASEPANAALVQELSQRLQAGWRGALVSANQPLGPVSDRASIADRRSPGVSGDLRSEPGRGQRPAPNERPAPNAGALALATEPQSAAQPAQESGERQVVYVSLGGAEALAIYDLNAQTGALMNRREVQVGKGPGAQTVDASRRFLYASIRGEKTVSALAIDPRTGNLSPRGATPLVSDAVFLDIDKTGRHLLTSYYAAGKAAIYPILADGKIGANASQVLETDKNPHSIRADAANRFVYVPNTGADKILQFRLDLAKGTLAPLDPPHVPTESGSGPRHFWFLPGGKFVYFVNEKGSSVTAFRAADSGSLSAFQTISTLPSSFQGANTCAHIEATPDGKYLYASNRGHDSLAIYAVEAASGKLTLVGHQATEKTPRSFAIDASSRFVYSAGQGSNNLAAYRIDAGSGKLSLLETHEVGAGPSWVQVVRLPR